MKKTITSIKKTLLWTSFLAMPLATTAIVISCGESQPEAPKNYRDNLISSLQKVTFFAPESVNNKMVTRSIDIDPVAKSYQYLSGNYPTLASAKAALETAWANSLPTHVDFISENRYLWLKITPKLVFELPASGSIKEADLNAFNGDNIYINLTESSQVRTFKSDLVESPIYSSLVLDNVTLSGTVDAPVISFNNLEAPAGTVFKITIGTTKLEPNAVIEYIKNNKPNLTTYLLANMVISAEVADKSRYVVSVTKTGVIKSTVTVPASMTSLRAALNNISFLDASTSASVIWSGIQSALSAKPAEVDKIEYHIGPEMTINDVIVNNNSLIWSADPANTVSDDHAQRHLYAKLTPTSGGTITNNIIDLTSTSRIQSIKTLVSVPSRADLGNITISGNVNNAVFSRLPINITNYKIQVLIKNTWIDLGNVPAYLRDNSSTLQYTDVYDIFVKIVILDETKYVASAIYDPVLILSKVAVTYKVDNTYIKVLENLKTALTSTHLAVTWDNLQALTTSKPKEIGIVAFYYGEESNFEQLEANNNVTWSTQLPTTINPVHDKRFLYVKLYPRSNVVLDNDIYGLTTSSNIQLVKTVINTQNYDLTHQSISGTVTNPVITVDSTNPPVPTQTQIVYKIKDSAWLNSAQIKAYIQSNAQLFQLSDLKTIKTKLVPLDETKYVLDVTTEVTLASPLVIV